jgi:DegV family protein with EDD domain
MRKGDNVICVTLTSKLSGTYNSARLGAEMVQAEFPNKKIFILDSLSASAGETMLLYELKRLIEKGGLTFEEIVKQITAFRDRTSLRFILQDLGNLIKTGRMSKVAGFIASTLLIKPIFGDNGNGEIQLCVKCMGTKKAINTFSDFPAQRVKEYGKDTPVFIAHCFNDEDANTLKGLLETKHGLTNIVIRPMRGLACFYANEKGLLMAY